MNIKLIPVDDGNREAILSLCVREDQPFVASNEVSLRQADETNAELFRNVKNERKERLRYGNKSVDASSCPHVL